MKELPRRRRGGPTLAVLIDLIRDAWWTRNWIVAAALLLAIVAAIGALAGQTALPFVVYSGGL